MQAGTYTLTDRDLVLDNQDKPYILRVRDLPAEEKPREKLSKLGPGALSNQELLAVILNTGTRKEEVMSMTARIFKEYGEKSIARQASPEAMALDLDIPLGKAMQIISCFELGRRFFQKNERGLAVIRTAKDVFEYLKDMRDLPKEHLRGVYLNSHHHVIHDEVVSIGTINANLIHPREVFRPALAYSAVAVVLAHNHPSGVLKPSAADIDVTRQLVSAGKILGIDLLDHVIITQKRFASIKVDY